jgi:hypothetical protein
MNEIQEIEVYVQPDGSVRIEVSGIKGKKCLDITKALEEALGGQVTARNHTGEFYEQEQQNDLNTYQSQHGQ